MKLALKQITISQYENNLLTTADGNGVLHNVWGKNKNETDLFAITGNHFLLKLDEQGREGYVEASS